MNGPTPGAITGITSTRFTESWQSKGACRTYGQPDLWFTVGNERSAQLDRQEAKRVCLTECPVLAECRAYALAVRESDGIWGGLDEQDREDVYAGRTNGACGTGGGMMNPCHSQQPLLSTADLAAGTSATEPPSATPAVPTRIVVRTPRTSTTGSASSPCSIVALATSRWRLSSA